MNRPVSGDATLRQYGLNGQRTRRNLWHEPGIRPAIATTGIRVGDEIATYYGKGAVTRVGTVAGFYMVNGTERRWTVESVVRINPVSL